MFVEGLLIAFPVDGEAFFLCHLLCEFDREAEGLVEIERVFPADDLVLDVIGDAGDEFFELFFAVFEGLLEEGFLASELFQNHGFVFLEFRIGFAVVVDDDFCDPLCERNGHSGLLRLADCTADQTAENVGLIDFARCDAVGKKEGGRAHVFDHNPFGACPFRRGLDSADFVQFLKEGLEDFGVIAAGFPLQNGGDALDAHAGIDVFLFQGQEFSVRGFIVLHEDVVPDFDPAFVLGIEDFRHRQRTVQ